MNADSTKANIDGLRADIQTTVKTILKLKPLISKSTELPGTADVPEMMANLTLAQRHLEDARMRLGKVLQAMDGGTSVYDK